MLTLAITDRMCCSTVKYGLITPQYNSHGLLGAYQSVSSETSDFLHLQDLQPETQQNNLIPEGKVRGKWPPCDYGLVQTNELIHLCFVGS